MRADRSDSPTSPLLAAARRRRMPRRGAGGGGGKKNKNNYVAKPRIRRGPNWGNRKNAGASRANTNARTRGLYTLKALAARKSLREFDRRASRIFVQIDKALRDGVDPKPHIDELTQ